MAGTLLAADYLGALVFQNCRLGPASQAWADQVVMEVDTIDGGVSWRSYTAEILDCRFTGGAGTAIDLYNYVDLLVSRNHIRGYRTGMTPHGEGHVTIDDNTVRDCLFATIDLTEVGSYGYVRNNEFRNCLRGIYAGGLIYELRPENNRIHAMREHGIWTVDAHYLIAAHNIISGCLGSGIQVDGAEFVLEI